MNLRLRATLWLALALGWSTALPLSAQPVPAGRSTVPALAPPPAVMANAPVQIFRKLLARTGAGREAILERYPLDVRKRLEEKIQEYEAMQPDERELRLRMTELRWYLLQFMHAPATNRQAQLALLSAADRDLVADRLQQWDRLPEAEQKEVLEYESTLQYFVPQDGTPIVAGTNVSANFTPAQREELTRKLERWNALPAAQREEMYGRFERFFKLTADERSRTLQVLTGLERVQMEKSLQTFAQLPPEQRDQCVKAFARFASLSSAEREEFLRNAERWREMSAGERQAWRNLVRRLPPLPAPPLPPPAKFAVPGSPPGQSQVVTTTNGAL